MSTANNVFRVSELEFDQIKDNLKNYLRSQDQFTDYDFDGSGLNILINLLSYNTHYMAWYLNMVANEMFLDSAVLKKSVYSHAKKMGYTPASNKAAIANVNITVTPPSGNTTTSLTIPKYTEFQSEAIDGQNYTFVNIEATTSTKNLVSNTFSFPSMELYQGEALGYRFRVSEANTAVPYVIPNDKLDTRTLDVVVQTSDIDSTQITYTESTDITTINANSQVYFLQVDTDDNYAVYFGDNYLGKSVANGNIVYTTFVATDGDAANRANIFTSISSIGGFSNVSVATNSAAAGGGPRETIEQIRFRAPIYYTEQNRAVTVTDYGEIITREYPNIRKVAIWGGEDNEPVVYGKVYVSLLPKSGFSITELEKSRIVNDLLATKSMPTVRTEIVDPNYLYLLVNSTIYYNKKATTLDESTLLNAVRTNIVNYQDNNLGEFDSRFEFSKLQNIIATTENSITSDDLTVTLQKRVTPTMGVTANYVIDFATELHRGSTVDKMYTYPAYTTLDDEGVTRTAYIEEVPLSYTGVDAIKVTNPGAGYTSTPTVTITGDGTGASATAKIVNEKIESISVVNRGSDYTIATVSISGGGGSGAAATAILNQTYGNLRSFYYKSSTGEKVILDDSVGTIDYSTGKINLLNFTPVSVVSNPNYSANVITFNITSAHQTLIPSRNRVILIDENDPLSIKLTGVSST